MNIELYKNDYVIINKSGEFVRFNNGQIVIYSKEEAYEDAKKGEKVMNVLDLNIIQKEILKENIKWFKK